MVYEFAIIGAGPAGSYCAYLLAKKGRKVLLLDESHPREKPCGGGIGVFTIDKFRILDNVKETKRVTGKWKLISPKNKSVLIQGRPGMIIGRKELDYCLLKEAINSDAEYVKEHASKLSLNKKNIWEIKTSKGTVFHATNIIGADGVNGISRKTLVSSFELSNLSMGAGYFIEKLDFDYAAIKFIPNGYMWMFPRKGHASVGFGIKLEKSGEANKLLDGFIEEYFPNVETKRKFAALIPSIKDTKFYDLPTAGKNWALIGDAAGHVDPVTGEGILYALWSAELAAKAAEGPSLQEYENLWRQEYGNNLKWAVRLSPLFYNPSIIELNILFSRVSKAYASIVFDILTSQQPYNTLWLRIIKSLPKILIELINPLNWKTPEGGEN